MARLIDADAVIRQIDEMRPGRCYEDAWALTVINSAPTVDAVPVVHGRWVKVHDEVCYWLACSVCGEEIPKRFGTDYYTKYCPNCGARMDGGVNDAAD